MTGDINFLFFATLKGVTFDEFTWGGDRIDAHSFDCKTSKIKAQAVTWILKRNFLKDYVLDDIIVMFRAYDMLSGYGIVV